MFISLVLVDTVCRLVVFCRHPKKNFDALSREPPHYVLGVRGVSVILSDCVYSAHNAFLYSLGQMLEHFVPFCSVLVCILPKVIVL